MTDDQDSDNEQTARRMLSLLESIPADDRLGFLYGILIGLMRQQGMSRIEMEKHLEFGLGVAFKDEMS